MAYSHGDGTIRKRITEPGTPYAISLKKRCMKVTKGEEVVCFIKVLLWDHWNDHAKGFEISKQVLDILGYKF